MFGAKAEKLPIYLKKGTKVTVAGQLLIDKWTGKDGKEKTTVVILINDIDFLVGKKISLSLSNQEIFMMRKFLFN